MTSCAPPPARHERRARNGPGSSLPFLPTTPPTPLTPLHTYFYPLPCPPNSLNRLSLPLVDSPTLRDSRRRHLTLVRPLSLESPLPSLPLLGVQ